ncbi:extracellular solute-binding protein [Photobacterium sp. ZSDE20]|uniref:sn-glycerol-3-phosphate-binding periplasmic protein UgpB n=1 Tax=Photobacterium pectinilyticum TaxID=2906793 RepID=A0ABT1N834_9GAMM|nr:extracellular solute-binding protein [Photobacterium sp. ZSDE20]MCQ1060886.1 extracellular solute-binding protein [Photobacterium sp. ZSDE20]MDD1828718.1 extracellular solute-binding protein [Photobacterium sp. ZSDE20]
MKLSAIATALTLVASATAANAATSIEFWHSIGGDVVDTICADFNAQSDNQVECIFQGDYEVAMQKAVASVRSKNHPALMQFYEVGTMDVMMSNIFKPLQASYSDVNWNAYISGAKGYYQSADNQLMSQPWNSSTIVLYSNKEVLAKAGINKAPETYEELVTAMKTLQESGHECPYTTDGHPWRVMEQVAARHGVEIASNSNGYDGLDAEYKVNEGLIVDHMNNLHHWNKQGLVKLDPQTRAGKYTSAFASGECAMMEASLSAYNASSTSLGDSLQISMAPVYQGIDRLNTFVGGGSLWMLDGHSTAEEAVAKEFLNYLRHPEVQKSLTAMTGYLPVTQEAYQHILDTTDSDDATFASVHAGYASLNQPSNSASRGIRLGFYTQFRSIFREETQKAFAGDISMQQALDNAKRRGDQLLRRFERTYKNIS